MLKADAGFLDRLARALEEGSERLAPEVLLVGSNLLGRELARRIREKNGGWANLRIFTLIDLARSLAGEAVPPSTRLLGPAGKLALAREALRSLGEGAERSAFGALTARQGLPSTLAAFFDDCIDAGAVDLPPEPPPEADGFRWRVLRSLYAHWRGRLGNGVLHPAQLIERGAACADRFAALFGCRRFWMAGFYDLTPVQESLIEALSRAGIGIIASLPQPRGRRGEFARRLRGFLDRIGAETPAAPEEYLAAAGPALIRLRAAQVRDPLMPSAAALELNDESLRIVSAPDEEREIREAAREIIRLFETHRVPFERMAVTFPVGRREVYLAVAEEVFPAAAIPIAGRPFGSVAREPDGRALRALLNLLGHREVPRHRLLDFLSYDAPAAALTPGLAPGRLERLSRVGGVVSWSGDWAARLRSAARPRPLEDSEVDGARLSRPPDYSPLDPPLEEAIASLKRFLDRLGAFPERGTWPELADALDGLVAASFPPLLSSGALQSIADTLRGLSELEPETSIDAFRAAWEDELRRARPPAGEGAGPGVRVGDLMELRGLVFDAVLVLGVAEGLFPSPPAAEPLLPDEARRGLARSGLRLAVKGERASEDRLLFASTVASTGRFLRLSFPRGDPEGRRRLLPSIFLLEAASLLAEKRVSALETEELDAVCHRIDLAHGSHGLERSLDPTEFDVAAVVEASAGRRSTSAVAEALRAVNPQALRLTAFEQSKWRRGPGPSDGFVPAELVARREGTRIGGRRKAISPSMVETFAACPHRYLLKHVLGLARTEDPEERFEIDPTERGILVHRILLRAYTAFQKDGLLPLSPETLAPAEETLRQISAEECERFAAVAAVGLPAVWNVRRAQLIESLVDLVRADAEEDGEWVPYGFELAFEGPTGVLLDVGVRQGEDSPSSVLFGGKIDRVDVRRGGGAVRVIDYKTGKVASIGTKDPFKAGEMIQLPVYLLAARQRIEREGSAVVMEESLARYRHLAGGDRDFPTSKWEDRVARLRTIVAEVARAIEAGEFFPTPQSNRAQCELCDFRHVCDSRVESIADLKGFKSRLGIEGEVEDGEPDAAD